MEWLWYEEAKEEQKEENISNSFKYDHIGDLFGIKNFKNEKQELKGYHLNNTPLSIIYNLLGVFDL